MEKEKKSLPPFIATYSTDPTTIASAEIIKPNVNAIFPL